MKKKKIDLSVPFFFGKEIKYIKDCVNSGWISSSGAYITKFENQISKRLKSKYAVGLINCTAALHLAIKLFNPSQGDEIIVPTISFVATINPVIYNNCSPIFMDCDESLSIDANKTLDFINENTFMKNGFCYNRKTKKKILCIIITHVFGHSANISENLLQTCRKKNIKIIEDAAESLGAYLVKKKKNIIPAPLEKSGAYHLMETN